MASLFRFKENDYLWPKLWLKKKNGRKSQILLRTLWHEKRVKNFFSLGLLNIFNESSGKKF